MAVADVRNRDPLPLTDGGLRTFLVRGVLGSGALKVAQALLSLVLAILLARILGPEGYGVYTFAFSLATVLAIPAQMGLPTLVVREMPRYHLNEEWGLLRGLLRRANQAVLGFTILLMLAAAVVLWLFGEADEAQRMTIAWALLLVPLIALGGLRSAALRGLHKVVQGQFSELLRPAFFVALTVVALLTGALGPPQAMALHSLAAFLSFSVGVVLLLRVLPPAVRNAVPAYETRTWVKSILPLSLLAGMQVIDAQADILMLALFTTNEEVGIYRVAAQGAGLVAFTLTVVNMVIAPQISHQYHDGNMANLQRMVTWSSRAILITSLPVATAFIFFGAPILSVLFGVEYAAGSTALAILCLGQLVNVATGSVGYLLNMTGYEKDTVRVVMVTVFVNIVLNLALIPLFGIEGAASATALSLATRNILLYRQVRKRLGIDSFAIPFLKAKHTL